MKVIIIRTDGEGRSFCRKLSDLAAQEACKPDIIILSRRETFCFPGLVISGKEGRVYRGGRDLNLTKREFELLYSCGQRAKRACLHAHLATAAGVNTPQLCCVASLLPRQFAAGVLTSLPASPERPLRGERFWRRCGGRIRKIP